ncbi:MAG TPA: ROK family protein [Mycobacteriales bacterium]|nr:ROK family protein [Mycobacteriales bacterium]
MSAGPGAADPVGGSPGELLRLLRTGRARSRSDLVALTGSSRSTVSLRVEQLISAGLLAEHGHAGSTGGRPARLLALRSDAGCVLAVDLGVTSADVALTDLSGHVLAETSTEVRVADGPRPVLDQVDRLTAALLRDAGRERGDVRAVGVGVPGPVEFATGRLVHPPMMPGWHDYAVPEAFASLRCPVLVDNDVNVMAAGELEGSTVAGEDFLVVKIGTGIGCGIVLGGQVYRGSTGSAGDIGHVHVPDPRHVPCSCGNENCLETLAGGAALARDGAAAGLPVRTARDLVELAVRADPQALALVREAGRRVGEVLASLVSFFNPGRIVVAGGVAHAGNPLLAGIREGVYRRALPLAARDLDISISGLGERAGRVGAARMAIEACLAPERIDADLERRVT